MRPSFRRLERLAASGGIRSTQSLDWPRESGSSRTSAAIYRLAPSRSSLRRIGAGAKYLLSISARALLLMRGLFFRRRAVRTIAPARRCWNFALKFAYNEFLNILRPVAYGSAYGDVGAAYSSLPLALLRSRRAAPDFGIFFSS